MGRVDVSPVEPHACPLVEVEMEYTAELDSTKNICTIRVVGTYHRHKETEELKRFAVNFHTEYGCSLFLIDMTQAEIVGGTIQTFKAAKPQQDIFLELISIKTAFLYRVISDQEIFLEDVAVNRGLQVKSFDSLDKAVEWLEQK